VLTLPFIRLAQDTVSASILGHGGNHNGLAVIKLSVVRFVDSQSIPGNWSVLYFDGPEPRFRPSIAKAMPAITPSSFMQLKGVINFNWYEIVVPEAIEDILTAMYGCGYTQNPCTPNRMQRKTK
jgi:hypothetical protein